MAISKKWRIFGGGGEVSTVVWRVWVKEKKLSTLYLESSVQQDLVLSVGIWEQFRTPKY